MKRILINKGILSLLLLSMFFSTNIFAQTASDYRAAAEKGNKIAQFNLGICYSNGFGVTKDDTQAVNWYRKAAEQGYAEAQYNLGVCYDKGYGVTKDYTQAVNWYRKAAEQGLAMAQSNLGDSYYYGHGVTKNYTLAVRLYREAAEQGVVRYFDVIADNKEIKPIVIADTTFIGSDMSTINIKLVSTKGDKSSFDEIRIVKDNNNPDAPIDWIYKGKVTGYIFSKLGSDRDEIYFRDYYLETDIGISAIRSKQTVEYVREALESDASMAKVEISFL
jgi:tetratricopeptide (TPR) repeat protein